MLYGEINSFLPEMSKKNLISNKLNVFFYLENGLSARKCTKDNTNKIIMNFNLQFNVITCM